MKKLKIFDRAYDKSAKLIPRTRGTSSGLAEIEEAVIRDACENSARLAYKQRQEYRAAIWRQFRWDTPEMAEQWTQIRNSIISTIAVSQ